MFPPRHAAGPGCRAMRMAVMTGDRDRNATPMSLRHATKARHVTLHIEFDTEQPTETMPDAGSPAHLFLYAASAYAIYNLVSSTMRDPLSWWNPPAIGGPHSREVAGKAAERRRAASQPPSQTLHHHQQTAAPSPPTTRPPPRPQCKARPPPKHQHPPRQQPRQPRMQHHHAPVATTTRRPPISISTKGWGNFGLEHLPPPERKREREREREDDGGSKRTRAAGLNECTSYRI